MLTFEEKLAIIKSFPELTRKDVSLGRINYHYENSASDKKNVVYHLHPNGNGFVYAEGVPGYAIDSKGMVNIRDMSEAELRTLIHQAIVTLTETDEPTVEKGQSLEETWMNRDRQTLTLVQEDDMWNVYAGVNLDGTFNSYVEAASYLDEEGFMKKY